MSFQDDIAEGLAELVSEAGVTIEIRRGAKRKTGVLGVKTNGRRTAPFADATLVTGNTDWLIMASDYDLGDGPTKPRRNDHIIYHGTTYEVLPADDGGDVYSGAIDCQHRIHTRVIS